MGEPLGPSLKKNNKKINKKKLLNIDGYCSGVKESNSKPVTYSTIANMRDGDTLIVQSP